MRTWIALASMLLTGCTNLAGGDHLDEALRGDPRIVGGQNAPADTFTYQVSIQSSWGGHFCGGSVIDDQWVLTAAHCVVGESASRLRVETGILNLSENGDVDTVAQIIVHPNYNSRTNANDVALLRLNGTTSAPPVALVDAVSEAAVSSAGTMAAVSGWGTLSSGGSSPDRLQYVEVPIVTNAECQAAYRGESIDDGMLCAGYIGQGGADSCQGDSGGPLVVSDGGELVQTGVVSWGYSCASPDYPGVYARVSEFVPWIQGYVPGVRLVSDGGPVEPTEPTEPPVGGDDHGDSVADATVVAVDGATTVSGTLDAGDEDVFRLELGGDGSLTVQTTGSTDTFGTLLSSGEAVLATDDDGGADYNFKLTRDAADGDVYYLVVRGYNGQTTGAYTLSIDGPAASGADTSDPGDTTGDTPELVEIVVDVSNTNNVTQTVSGFLNAGQVDYYAVDLRDSQASTMVVDLQTTGGTDTFGSIYDADGNLLASDDDGGASYNFRIAGSISTGVYLVEVKGYDANTSGAYTLSVKGSWQ